MTRRRVWATAGVVALALAAGLAAYLGAQRPEDALPLAPTSTEPGGAQALVELLESLGSDVIVDDEPPERADRVLLLSDQLDEAGRDDLRARAEDGAVVVVVDAASPLAPDPVGEAGLGFISPPLPRDCGVEALADAERVRTGSGFVFEDPSPGWGCYRQGPGAWMVGLPEGDGWLVVTGGGGWLSNQGLSRSDNVVAAASLLAPEEGTAVWVVPPRARLPGMGTGDPLALLPTWVPVVGAQLLVGGALLALWRARRLGRALVEEQPVAVPGSELVLALGGLHAQRRDAAHAAASVRAVACRDLAGRLGLDRQADADAVAAAAAAAGVDPGLVDAALRRPVIDDAGLLEASRAVEGVRAALVGGDRAADEASESAAAPRPES